MDGIYCSNHGGRQSNGGLPALEALPAVVEAADGLPVLFDSGIRSGADIGKAIALGGTDGIVHVLRSLLAEADLIMAVDGCSTLGHLTPEAGSPSPSAATSSGKPSGASCETPTRPLSCR